MIRRLTDFKHIPKIIRFGCEWHEKTALAELPFSPKRCEQTLKQAMLSPDHIVLGAFDKERLCGVLVGALCAYPWFEASYATDLVFIADKHGLRLFRAFCEWASRHKVDAVQMGVTSGLPYAEKLYGKLGMQRIGGIYFHKLG